VFKDDNFHNLKAEKTNQYTAQRQTIKSDQTWDDMDGGEIQAYTGILIYMGLRDLP
jgi:hypothetical protein